MSGLEGLGIVANVFGVVGLSLKIITWCSIYARNVKDSNDGRARLFQAVITLHYKSDEVHKLLSSKKGSKLQASQRLYHAQVINSENELRKLEKKLSQGNGLSLKWPLQKEEAETAIQNIEKSTKTMLDVLQIDMTNLLVGIDDRAEAEEQRATIDQLPYVSDAVWNSYTEDRNAKCLPNTREKLLEEVEVWIKDTTRQSKAVFWLNGMAGTGKSTISRTISQRLAQDGRLGATFFFKRGEADRGGISKMMPTIARQLSMNQPLLSPHIHAAIRNDPAVASKPVREQFNDLILKPLMKSSGQFSSNNCVAIVIDALDECDLDTEIRLVVNMLSTVNAIHCPRPRVFITSRPDLPVRLGFKDVEGSYRDLILHDISASIIKQDISTFFCHKMKLIREDWNASVGENRKLPQDWPGSEYIRSLVDKAVPLFIFAATACRFISERQLGSPEKQLRRFLEYQAEGTTSQLGFTYRSVLAHLFSSNCSKSSESRIILEFRRVVGTIINLFDPLSTSALSRLLDIDQDIIDSKLDLLHSVLDVPPSPDAPIRMLHLSFRDYLLSPETKEHKFWIDEKASARNLAKDCLRVMETLQPDICHLKMPGTPRSTLKPEFINACIPPEVQYACLYWVNHQVVARFGPKDATRILTFLKQHLLHWVEAMSLLGRAFQITKLMRELLSVIPIESTGDETELTDFLDDATRFVDMNIQTVDLEPLQIYCSLLVLAPSNSLVKQTLAAKTPAWLTLLNGQVTDWDSRLHSVGYSDDPIKPFGASSLTFLPGSESLCFISKHGNLQVWNCDTGECIHDIEPEPENYSPITLQDDMEDLCFLSVFRSPTVSPDAKSVAVILERGDYRQDVPQKIVIFDLTTGQLICETSDHCSYAFAFSRDSKFIWSCTIDGQVCVWDSCTGVCTERLDCPVKWTPRSRMEFSLGDPKVLIIWDPDSTYVWYLEASKADEGLTIQQYEQADYDYNYPIISPDGRLLVTPSSDGLSLVVWDISERKSLWELSEDIKTNGRQLVTFSPDSTFLAMGGPHSIRIWDMRDGKCLKILVLPIYGTVSSMTFSPDEQYLISTHYYYNNETWLWDINTGICFVSNIEHSCEERPLLFPPDGKKIVSETYSGFLQLWDWQKLLEVPPKSVSKLESLVFSPDSSMTAALFKNNDITIWDTETGAVLRRFSCPLTQSVAFSPDSSLIATTNSEGSVHVWNLHEPDVEWQFTQTDQRMRLIFSPDSQAIATWGTEIKIWMRESGTFRFKTLLSPGKKKRSFCFSRDAKLISTPRHDRVDVWNCDTGQLVQSLPFGVSRVMSIDLQPSTVSSYAIVVAVQRHIEVWDLGTCSCIRKVHSSPFNSIVSSRGIFAAESSEETLCIWNWLTGETLTVASWPSGSMYLKDFDPESLVVRTSHGDWALSSESGHGQLTQMCGFDPKWEWIQWKDHNLFKMPSFLRGNGIEVAPIPGESLGFTVAIGPQSGGDPVILRFSNEGGMLDDLISR